MTAQMTFAQATALRDTVDEINTRHSEILAQFPKGPMGLTPDVVKESPEWKRAKADFENSFAKLREFNSWYVKTFKKEIAAARAARYAK